MPRTLRTIHRIFPLIFVILALGCGKRSKDAASGAPPTTNVTQGGATHHAALEVHGAMTIDLDARIDPSEAAREIEALATSKGGFVEESSTQGSSGAHLVVRIPAADVDALRVLLSTLRSGGTTTEESISAKDVGDAIADLDARLHAAREEEARILKILEQNTGSIADVLTVERTLADVRDRVERLEAEQRVAQGRVDLATIDVSMRAHVVEPTVARQIALAARDGGRILGDAVVATLTFLLRFGPTLLFFAALIFAPWIALRRTRRQRVASSA